jgi:hypothetical protein
MPELKIYSTLDEIKESLNPGGSNNSSKATIKNIEELSQSLTYSLNNKLEKNDNFNFGLDMDNLQKTDAAWVHLVLCKLHGVQYMDETHTQLQYPTVSQLIGTLPGESLNGTNDFQTHVGKIEVLSTKLAKSVTALNKMVADGVVEKLELSHVLTSEQTGGAITEQITETPNYYAIANVIKHNNYMLLNYLTNADNVSGYTEEMHGGGAFDIKKFYFDHGNLVEQPPIVPKVGIVKKNDMIVGNLGSRHSSEIVDVINEQILALKEKGKRLSNNSNDKVQKVVGDIIDKYNQVNEVVAQLLAHNTFPSVGKVANIEKDNEPYKRLEKALREKNRSELKGLAVSEGLSAALSDVVRSIVSSSTSMPLGLTIV